MNRFCAVVTFFIGGYFLGHCFGQHTIFHVLNAVVWLSLGAKYIYKVFKEEW